MLGGPFGRAWFLATLTLSVSASMSAHADGNADEGEKKFYTCLGCHGIDNYKNAYPDYDVPRLRHQTAVYLVAALEEYKTGDRPHATMHQQASSLSDQDMQDIAAYLQGAQPIKPSSANPGTAPAQVVSCVACHGENGTGIDAPLVPKPPILAGQHADYLQQALQQYKSGRRKNAVMGGMAQSLTNEADIKIAADYFAAQPSPLATVK